MTTILAIDVHYHDETAQAVVAGVLFDGWAAEQALSEHLTLVSNVMPYQPGQFYQRELPCITALVEEHGLSPEIIVVDGHVFLDAMQQPGLGHYVHMALTTPVIGVAKKAFHSSPTDAAIVRGTSTKPLYVTAVGFPSAGAREAIVSMAGPNRIPTLLKLVDSLCRDGHRDLLAG